MPRRRKLWVRAETNSFYTKIDGKPTRLGPVEKGEPYSWRLLEKMLRGQHSATSSEPGMTFARLADRYLAHSKATNEEGTFEVHRRYLQSFCDHVKQRLVAKVVEADLDAWCQIHAKGGHEVQAGGRKGGTREAAPWSENTQARAKAIVLAAMNYGVKKLGLPPHPLRHVKPGTVGSRTRYLSPDDRGRIKEALAGTTLLDYVRFLELTGCRPFSEAAKLTAEMVDFEKGTATVKKWKNVRKQKDRKRTIYLVAPALEIVKVLAEWHPDGSLFRNSKGGPWVRQALTARFRSLGEVLGIEGLAAYDFRAAYITEALERGVPVAVVAELTGTSIQTINRHYVRLDKKHESMMGAANLAVGL